MSPSVRFEHRAFDRLSPRELHDLLKLRSDVFIVEQRIVDEPDLDGRDPAATHVLGVAPDGGLVATARVEMGRRPFRVARVVVHRAWRHRGVGRALMNHVHDLLGTVDAELSAQAPLVPWYETLGWRPVGPVYDEAGVPHRRMTRGASA